MTLRSYREDNWNSCIPSQKRPLSHDLKASNDLTATVLISIYIISIYRAKRGRYPMT